MYLQVRVYAYVCECMQYKRSCKTKEEKSNTNAVKLVLMGCGWLLSLVYHGAQVYPEACFGDDAFKNLGF